ncbi:hypothetical protein [Myroides odoratus]|uniref:hypothetical protein n=1 Tax=Myroides odoratus TaxID=256 RepID=UPI000AA8D5C8|nr:hypothetical protein [Myroides odoratus]
MIKNTIQYTLSLGIALLCTTIAIAQTQDRPFPYFLPLTGTTAPSEIGEYLSDIAPTGRDRYTSQGLVLTQDEDEFSFSGFYLKDVEFPANYGLIVEFQYAMVDGKKYDDKYGDGISMFLFDGTKDFEIGAPGASLGYANKNSVGGNQPGLNGAYLGFGLDVFGSYKLRGTNSGERREGISGIDFTRPGDHITLRGGQYKNDRYKGYPVVFTEQVLYASLGSDGIAHAELDYNTGDYTTDSYSYSVGINELRTGYFYGDVYDFNRVVVTLIPIDNGNGGMKVSLIMYDKRNFYKNPLNNFIYPNSFKTRDESGNLYTFETKIPDVFHVGFAAGTGGATQTQIIKNVKIDLPYAPETKDKEMLLCLTNGDDKESYSHIKEPFNGDRFYMGTVDAPTGSEDGSTVDRMSFRFEDEHGFDITTRTYIEYNSRIIEYDQPGIGTWQYQAGLSGYSSDLYFEPTTNDVPEGDYVVYFSAKSKDDGLDGPFSHHVYRSRPTKVTLKARWCKSVVNPNLPIRVIEEEEEEE